MSGDLTGLCLYMFASITSLTFEVQNNHSRKAASVSDVEMR